MSLIDRAVEQIRANRTNIRDHYAVAEVISGLDPEWRTRDEYERRALVLAAVYRCEREGISGPESDPVQIN
jgi:hypothetical protein